MSGERISAEEAIRRGYIWGRIGYNHAAGRRIVADLRTIHRLSPGGFMSVSELNEIRDSQAAGQDALSPPGVAGADGNAEDAFLGDGHKKVVPVPELGSIFTLGSALIGLVAFRLTRRRALAYSSL